MRKTFFFPKLGHIHRLLGVRAWTYLFGDHYSTHYCCHDYCYYYYYYYYECYPGDT